MLNILVTRCRVALTAAKVFPKPRAGVDVKRNAEMKAASENCVLRNNLHPP